MLEIVLRQEDANTESVLLVEWLVGDREPVRAGQPVCVVETSKSAIEIESPGDGTLCQLVQAGTEVDVGTRIAAIAATEDELSQVAALAVRTVAPVETAEGQRTVTRKAAALAAEHGLDLSRIEKQGFVTVEDVEALLAEAVEDAAAAGDPALAGISLRGVTLPAVYTGDTPDLGVVETDFLASLRSDPAAFGRLSPEEKVDAYRRHGARIGEGVRFGAGVVVAAPRIVLGDGVDIGDEGSVDCVEAFVVGAGTMFGRGLRARCRRIYVGEGGYLTQDVHFGGGGHRDPQALLVLGDLVFVGDEAFVNPCRPVVVGREVFITMRSVIVTHNVGHSVLEGFENRFAPVVLEDRAQVGIGVVVYAGSRIGQESIVASNSYVVSDIAPGKLASGVPARATGSSSHAHTPGRTWELAEAMLAELVTQLELRGHEITRTGGDAPLGFTLDVEGAVSQVLLVERIDEQFRAPEVDGETVVLTLAAPETLETDVPVIDLLGRRLHGTGGALLDSVREYCRKRGIRVAPGPWRYRGGLL